MAAVIRLQNSIVRRVLPTINKRCISTSKKNSDTATVDAESKSTTSVTTKNWVSYGFDRKDEAEDRRGMHSTFFFSVTLCLVFGGFFWAYTPDYNLRDWSQREAFLELRRREKLGLPLVDANLVDPKKIQLPSDEELGDTEIII
ncbi:NADH dehydrogenase [ubiquinone] 1 beta subcomplex subunit 11, mitochondrial [Onthophagus taurus]|uniref:NADH dehydrogenase [ubiquinone] 1 beta subcomplex subunit 11, mitochondrial n=1 Tax=Onthophagus taurus TaxID=166361 RepID=UPI000C205B32|nr:NADH dehydrogenase [ubiquinone] 1 beta subcomplex subunit 11, mitochondrial [Onthophagus taurus]